MSDSSFRSVGDLFPHLISQLEEAQPIVRKSTASKRRSKLVEKIIEIGEEDVLEANALGFSSRVQVQVSLPHRDPGKPCEVWTRRNGHTSLSIVPGKYVDRSGKVINIGFPYGTIPRLILAYLSTTAVRTKSPDIDLGQSMAEFMHRIGMISNGLHIRRLKNQLNRLVSSNISFRYETGEEEAGMLAGGHRPIAKDFRFWWDMRQPEQQMLFPSFVRLDQDFFQEIMEHPVPIDLRAIQVLKQSSLSLDLYTWLTHRVSYLNKPARIPWVSLEKHIGSEYGNTRDFKKKCKESLRKIQCLWPELKLEEARGALLLKPSSPHVSKTMIQVPASLNNWND